MKRCDQCGVMVKDEANFCQNCGGTHFSQLDSDVTIKLRDGEEERAGKQSQNDSVEFHRSEETDNLEQNIHDENEPFHKRKKSGYVVITLLCVVIALFIFVLLFYKTMFSKIGGSSETDNEAYSMDGTATDEAEITDGTFHCRMAVL